MNHLCTFSGIGGWALAARWMGWNHLGFVEKEKYCQKVLAKNFPGVPIHDDIFDFSAKPFRGRVDILTGSTPCQPFSQAGKRQGSNDERHLFPEFLRVVQECEPRWIVIENVRGLLGIESGEVFEAYCSSLEGAGYAVTTFCVPACAVDAAHRRERIWIVAHSPLLGRGTRRPRRPNTSDTGQREQSLSALADAYGFGGGASGAGEMEAQATAAPRDTGEQSAFMADPETVHAQGLHNGSRAFESGRSGRWPTEPAVDRVADGVPDRVDRLKSLGNAIVPQVAFEIFKAIEAAEEQQ